MQPTQKPAVRQNPKILFLQCSSIFEQFGGIEYYLDDLETLAAEICGPSRVHAIIPWRLSSRAPDAANYPISWVRLPAKGIQRKLSHRFSYAYFREAIRLTRDFRPTLVLNGHVSLGPVALALSRRYRIPFVTCAYGIESWGNLWPQDEFCLRRCDAILSISHWTKKVLVGRGIPGAKIRIVQPRLPEDFEKVSFERQVSRVSQPLRLLTVSRLDAKERYKGQDDVLKALVLLKKRSPELPLKYLIHGEGSDQGRLEAMTKEFGLQDLVQFHPKVKDRTELAKVYGESDLFIMPSRFGRIGGSWRGEGFGIVYLEAAAFGLPSIAYDCGGATDFIQSNVNGLLVKPGDIEGLAKEIEALARDRDRLFQLGARAFDIARKDFNRQSIRAQVERLLFSV
jgi:phosphatidyl-myo-inositol dimannoside synthase